MVYVTLRICAFSNSLSLRKETISMTQKISATLNGKTTCTCLKPVKPKMNSSRLLYFLSKCTEPINDSLQLQAVIMEMDCKQEKQT